MKKGKQAKIGENRDLNSLERTVGLKIREKRINHAWTQKDLAIKLGISYQQVQKYETGINRVSAGRLFQISNLLETKIDEFFNPAASSDFTTNGRLKRPTIQIEGDLLTEDVRAALNNLVKVLAKRIH